MRRVISAGDRFGRLVAVSLAGYKKWGYHAWLCRCDCGATPVVDSGSLRTGNTKSCGCIVREMSGAKSPRFKHGGTCGRIPTPEYAIWQGMVKRCTVPSCNHFDRYGGRGISVCDRWRDFRLFLEDMGDRPSTSHSIERINNDGNYCPENCKWATRDEQSNNRSNSTKITYNGKTLTSTQWQKETGIPHRQIRCRIFELGWTAERALTTPTDVRLHEWNGRSLTLREWSAATGIQYDTIKRRLALCWSIERALTEKPRHRSKA